MKKKLLKRINTALVIIAVSGVANQYAYAQNIFPGVSTSATGGNCGIGTTSPAHNLEIDQVSSWNGPNGFPAPCAGCSSALTINTLTYDYSWGANQTQLFPSTPTFNLFEIFYHDVSLVMNAPQINKTCLTVNSAGQTAINKATASHTLDVGGDINADNDVTVNGTLNVTGNLIKGLTNAGELVMTTNTGSNDGPTIEMYGPNYTYDPSRAGGFHFVSYGNAHPAGGGNPLFNFEFINYDPSTTSWTANMAIAADGRTLIGSDLINNYWSSMPLGYNLYVSKGILTERLKVAVDPSNGGTDWSDFVFAKNYKLLPLSEVATYVKENKHLPEIPSAAEVGKDGIDVAKMDAKLLQKIEELTLYAIQQQKEIEELKKEIRTAKQ